MKKPKFAFFKQKNATDCGPSCLRMIANYYGMTYSLDSLTALCSTSPEGTTVFGLGQAAEFIGLNAMAVFVTYETLYKVPLPAIALWLHHHYIVIYLVKKNKVYVADPIKGLKMYTKYKFIEGWLNWDKSEKVQGMLLLLEPSPTFQNQRIFD